MGEVCCYVGHEVDEEFESARCLVRGCRALHLRARGETLDQFRRRLRRHATEHARQGGALLRLPVL